MIVSTNAVFGFVNPVCPQLQSTLDPTYPALLKSVASSHFGANWAQTTQKMMMMIMIMMMITMMILILMMGITAIFIQALSLYIFYLLGTDSIPIDKHGNIGNFSGVKFIILSLLISKLWAALANIIEDIPEFTGQNVPISAPVHNTGSPTISFDWDQNRIDTSGNIAR